MSSTSLPISLQELLIRNETNNNTSALDCESMLEKGDYDNPQLYNTDEDEFPSCVRREISPDSHTMLLPNDIDWDILTKIFLTIFQAYPKDPLKGLLECIYYMVKSNKPIFITVEGHSGHGKTSLVLRLLRYLLWKYRKVALTPEILPKYFKLGEHVSLNPQRLAQEYEGEPDSFFVLDEAYFVINNLRKTSTQNQQAINLTNVIRTRRIYGFYLCIEKDELDSRFVNDKVWFNLVSEFSTIKTRSVLFHIEINAKGRRKTKDGDYDKVQGFFQIGPKVRLPWCLKSLYDSSDDIKTKFGQGLIDDNERPLDYATNEAMWQFEKEASAIETNIQTILDGASGGEDALYKLLRYKHKHRIGNDLTQGMIIVRVEEKFGEDAVGTSHRKREKNIKRIKAQVLRSFLENQEGDT